MELDWITIAVLMGALYGPISALQAPVEGTKPWREVPGRIKALIIGAFAFGAALFGFLVAVGRPLLAAALVASSVASYLIVRGRKQRSRL